MGKLENALREEIMRFAKKVARETQAKTVDDVRRLKARVAALQADLAGVKRKRAQAQARERLATAEQEVPSEAGNIRVSAVLIKKLRKRLGVSQPQLAVLLGVSNAAVGFWESGKTNPRPETKTKIAALRRLGRRDVRRLLEETA